MRARALGISGVSFCPGISFREVNFSRALGFWQFFTKNVLYLIRVKKSDLLAEEFQFWHCKVYENLPGH